MKRKCLLTPALLILLIVATLATAQEPAPPPVAAIQPRSAAELEQMLGPIALYPDPLIAQILPASSVPAEIVLADRYVSGGGDPNQIDQQPWDDSVRALARYPTVLKWMDDNLAWTTTLGQVFLNQQQDVMDAIQRLRAKAQGLGNLRTTPQENVVASDGAIEILPADPQVIYVPVYQPEMVYYQQPYGSPFMSFGIGFGLGGWLDCDFDWHNHHLITWSHEHPRPADWWHHPGGERPRFEASHATVWQPRNHSGLAAGGLDRGWDSHPVHSAAPSVGGRAGATAGPGRAGSSAAPRRVEPVVQHPVQTPRSRPASGALIGVQSSRQTQQFSNRGQQSRQAVVSRPAAAPSRPAAPPRPAAPIRSSGGGKH
jgi:Protein of unknown function (DUF3300)